MTIFRFFLLFSLLAFMLSACGQRGPLYLPDESTPVVVPADVRQPGAVPPDPLDTGFEDEDEDEGGDKGNGKPAGDPIEDEPANGR